MIAKLVLEVIAVGPMGGQQVARVRHVVENLNTVYGDVAQILQLPTHPLGVVPFGQVWRLVLGLLAIRVEPHHQTSHHVAYRI